MTPREGSGKEIEISGRANIWDSLIGVLVFVMVMSGAWAAMSRGGNPRYIVCFFSFMAGSGGMTWILAVLAFCHRAGESQRTGKATEITQTANTWLWVPPTPGIHLHSWSLVHHSGAYRYEACAGCRGRRIVRAGAGHQVMDRDWLLTGRFTDTDWSKVKPGAKSGRQLSPADRLRIALAADMERQMREHGAVEVRTGAVRRSVEGDVLPEPVSRAIHDMLYPGSPEAGDGPNGSGVYMFTLPGGRPVRTPEERREMMPNIAGLTLIGAMRERGDPESALMAEHYRRIRRDLQDAGIIPPGDR